MFFIRNSNCLRGHPGNNQTVPTEAKYYKNIQICQNGAKLPSLQNKETIG